MPGLEQEQPTQTNPMRAEGSPFAMPRSTAVEESLSELPVDASAPQISEYWHKPDAVVAKEQAPELAGGYEGASALSQPGDGALPTEEALAEQKNPYAVPVPTAKAAQQASNLRSTIGQRPQAPQVPIAPQAPMG